MPTRFTEFWSEDGSLRPTGEDGSPGPLGGQERNPETSGLRATIDNVWAGTRLALMLPLRREAFRVNLDQAVLLLLIGFAATGLAEFAFTEPVRAFNSSGLGYMAAGYLAFLLGLYLVARIQKAHSSMVDLVVVVSSATPVTAFGLEFVLWLGGSADAPTSSAVMAFAWLVVFAWLTAIIVRALRLVYEIRVPRAIFLVMVFFAIHYGAAAGAPQEQLWYSVAEVEYEADDPYEPYRRINIETTYRAQRGLLDDVFAGLLPQRGGTTDLYFVGFGSYAYEDVFLKEVRTVRALFDELFDTGGRSVALINNLSTLETVPLASVGNLKDVLGEMASRMDVEEDILFLFLTSHGSSKHVFSVDFWPLGLNDLRPDELRRILDGSGIKWRVVVVSACYSGGFIEALEDDFTLVMTAARKDRTSFGCGSLSDFTYFGKAYFDEALRSHSSFIEGFYAARESILEREQREDLSLSYPQIQIGPAIEARLKDLETRLRGLQRAEAGG